MCLAFFHEAAAYHDTRILLLAYCLGRMFVHRDLFGAGLRNAAVMALGERLHRIGWAADHHFKIRVFSKRHLNAFEHHGSTKISTDGINGDPCHFIHGSHLAIHIVFILKENTFPN